jgi:hypothetical protein
MGLTQLLASVTCKHMVIGGLIFAMPHCAPAIRDAIAPHTLHQLALNVWALDMSQEEVDASLSASAEAWRINCIEKRLCE